MSNKKLFIIGCGNVGGFIASNPHEFIGETYNSIEFLDDDEQKIGKEFFGYKVTGSVNSLNQCTSEVAVVICIANPKIRQLIAQKINSPYVYFPSFISKNAWFSNKVTLGKGIIIYPGVSINYNATIENFSIINLNSAIGHDCTISQFCTLAPGVSLGGFSFLEEGVDMGINSATKQGIKIGRNTIIGGMGMVTKNIPSDCTAVGVPAKTIKFHSDTINQRL